MVCWCRISALLAVRRTMTTDSRMRLISRFGRRLISNRGGSWQALHSAPSHRAHFTTEGVRICGSTIGVAWPDG